MDARVGVEPRLPTVHQSVDRVTHGPRRGWGHVEGWYTERVVVRGCEEVTETSWVRDEDIRVSADLDHPLGFDSGIYQRSLDDLVPYMTARVDEALARIGQPTTWPSLVRDLAIVAAAPTEVPHAELLLALRILIEVNTWTPRGSRASRARSVMPGASRPTRPSGCARWRCPTNYGGSRDDLDSACRMLSRFAARLRHLDHRVAVGDLGQQRRRSEGEAFPKPR